MLSRSGGERQCFHVVCCLGACVGGEHVLCELVVRRPMSCSAVDPSNDVTQVRRCEPCQAAESSAARWKRRKRKRTSSEADEPAKCAKWSASTPWVHMTPESKGQRRKQGRNRRYRPATAQKTKRLSQSLWQRRTEMSEEWSATLASVMTLLGENPDLKKLLSEKVTRGSEGLADEPGWSTLAEEMIDLCARELEEYACDQKAGRPSRWSDASIRIALCLYASSPAAFTKVCVCVCVCV